ncbi:helix-turn-helix domain-containing protein [Streptomyces cavernicola]|uniref:Helix-turn-helix transcriptional regulator n=1 Tax=Streptomyces cavernicola TaxID=3043613 RepID=A0ABT6SJI9_9ACTN|nr:helix-turn-helix transcriptional regulator [Streptomyces sp. B-S-A6]MDI3407827.1 helix-turn-helix transcriptional regulator [Streptomyces sp. B-S-A6]
MARAENRDTAGTTARQVAEMARAMRIKAGLSQEELGRKIGYTAAAVSAMERCTQPASDEMLVALERVIGGGLGFFERAREYMRLERYPAQFQSFARIEQQAITLSAYETVVVYGLFQTAEYARALIGGGYPPLSEERVEELVAGRMARRALFDRRPVPLLELIMDESVLSRGVGSPAVMREQLLHLVECAQRPNVVLHVLPADRGFRGENAGMRGPMVLVETDESERFVYLEPQDESVLISAPAKLRTYAHRYAKIRCQALDTEHSLALVERLAGELK